jgi:formiminoglutamase
LISIPHGGNEIPSEVTKSINITQKDIFYDGDTLANNIYNFKEKVAALVTMPVARAILDVNRAPEDLPPENPDGIIKTITLQGKSVYRKEKFPGGDIIDILLKKYYLPYHIEITSLLKKHDIKLALDCHTMLEYAPATDINPGQARPVVCLSNGGDETGNPKKGTLVTCPPEWMRALARSFRDVCIPEGDVALNSPFTGGHISQHHHRTTGVPWIQIELNRRLYLSDCNFDARHLHVENERIMELQTRIFSAIKRFWETVS